MRYSHDLKLALVSNWKCGCSTIATIFNPYTEWNWQTREQCMVIHGRPYAEMAHSSAAQQRREFKRRGWDWSDYRSISSVRNPWARTLSLYKYEERIAKGTFGWTFDDYVVRRLKLWKGGRINRWNTREMFHDWRGRRLVDHVVRLENLAEELGEVVAEHWPQLEVDFSRRVNTTKHDHYSSYYSPRTRDIVAKHFAYDIAEWGYEFEEPSVI